MSFFKKFSETVKDTASSIGSKSMDMVESGKLKLQRNQLETAIKDKKTEIGDLIYISQKQTIIPDANMLTAIFDTIKDLENQIEAIDEKLHKETVQMEQQPDYSKDTQYAPTASTVFCSRCGQELSPTAKFCNSCGQAQQEI